MTNIIKNKNKNKNKKRGNKIKSTFRNKKKKLRTSSIKNNVKIKNNKKKRNNNKKKIFRGGADGEEGNSNDENPSKLNIRPQQIHSQIPKHPSNYMSRSDISVQTAANKTNDITVDGFTANDYYHNLVGTYYDINYKDVKGDRHRTYYNGEMFFTKPDCVNIPMEKSLEVDDTNEIIEIIDKGITAATDDTDDDSNKTGDSNNTGAAAAAVATGVVAASSNKTKNPNKSKKSSVLGNMKNKFFKKKPSTKEYKDTENYDSDDNENGNDDKPQGEKPGMFSGMLDRFKNKDPSKPGMFSKMFGSKSKNTDSSSDPIIEKQDCFTSEDSSTNQIVLTIPSKAAGVEVINNIKMDDKLKAIAEVAVEPNKETESAAASGTTPESQTGGRLNKSKRNRRFQLRKRSRKRNRGKNNKK